MLYTVVYTAYNSIINSMYAINWSVISRPRRIVFKAIFPDYINMNTDGELPVKAQGILAFSVRWAKEISEEWSCWWSSSDSHDCVSKWGCNPDTK